MSNIYITEPPTSGKVLLKTSVGDIDIELWSKETPKACKNFIQLCLEGYYDNTIFHRVVQGFIVQGGDPNGDGTGGESIYGAPFKDEFHSRLRFNRRGLIGMANSGKDDNGSQFFFTLTATPELQNTNTLFAKVTGDTLFNMLKLEEGLIINERPSYPQKILKTVVLNNPFPDIKPRVKEISKLPNITKKAHKNSEPGVKNLKLLSFGDDPETEFDKLTDNSTNKGMVSSHDILNDPKLSSQTAENDLNENEQEMLKFGNEDVLELLDDDQDEIDNEKQLQIIKLKLMRKKLEKLQNKNSNVKTTSEDVEKKRQEVRLEIEAVKKELIEFRKKEKSDLELRESSKNDNEEEAGTSANLNTDENDDDYISIYKKTLKEFKSIKKNDPKKSKSEEYKTLSLLHNFKAKISTVKDDDSDQAKTIISGDNNKTKGFQGDWLLHKLENEEAAPILARDANLKNDDWYEIYDPKNPLNKRRRGDDSVFLKKSKQ